MIGESGPPLDEMPFQVGHVGQRVHVEVLIIGQDEENVWPRLGRLERLLLLLRHQWLYKDGNEKTEEPPCNRKDRSSHGWPKYRAQSRERLYVR